MSISLRRTAAPSRTSARSSGENSTAVMVPASSEALFFTELTSICFLCPGASVIFTVCSRPAASTSASISAEEKPKPTISRSKRVRKLFPPVSMNTASSRFVFPCPFLPRMTLVPGSKVKLSHS